MKQCLVDTGALVALLDRADLHHGWAFECFKKLRPPLTTCESVLAETSHLLADLSPSVTALARLYADEILRVDFDFKAHAPAVWRLVQKHRDLHMDFADACLVRMSELHTDCLICTTDAHFRVYRNIQITQVPEPSTVGLLGLAFLGLLGGRRIRK